MKPLRWKWKNTWIKHKRYPVYNIYINYNYFNNVKPKHLNAIYFTVISWLVLSWARNSNYRILVELNHHPSETARLG